METPEVQIKIPLIRREYLDQGINKNLMFVYFTLYDEVREDYRGPS